MQLWRYGLAVERLGQRYRLRGALGSGGMADVCLAWDEREQREVAIKVIKPDGLDQRALDRFVKEAAQVAQWRHPHILRIYSDLKLELLDPAKGSIIPYIVMEYAQGGDLQKRLTPGQPYPLNKLLDLFPQLCSAVSYAHQRGVVHRDLKPLNILFRRLPGGEEQVVLSDFGLAVEVSATHYTYAHGGTLPYMAPEQFQGYVLPASDIFALGVILYQLTTGHLPFRRSLRSLLVLRGARDSQEQVAAEAMKPPVAPSQLQPTLPPAFDDVIARALAEDPATRYSDALQLWEDASIALFGSLASTSLRSSTRRSRAARMSTASLPLDSTPVAPPASAPREASNADDDGPGSYLSTDSAIPVATSRAGHWSYASAHGSGAPRDGEELPSSSRGKSRPVASASRSRPGRDERGDIAAPLARRQVTTRPAGKRRTLVAGMALLLLLLLSGATLAYLNAAHTILPPGVPLLSNSVDVTITPASKTLSQAYPIMAVMGSADPARMKVQARMASAPIQTRQKSASATGMRKTPGTQAKGTLTFLNGSFKNPFTVNAGYTIVGADGTPVVTDTTIVIPIANPNMGDGQASVAAHAVTAGTTGNIVALDVNHVCCISDNSVFVKNINAFTGGQDPKSYAFVQQSDVDAVANPLKGELSQQGLSALRGQIAAREQPVDSLSERMCSANVSSDHPVGDTGVNVTAATVTVAVTCAVEVFDSDAAKRLAAQQLSAQAGATLGSGYTLRDGPQEEIAVQGVDQQRTVALTVQARGNWVYRFSDDQRQTIARKLAGKSRASALRLLQQMSGIGAASLPVDVTTLPGDAGRINIIIL